MSTAFVLSGGASLGSIQVGMLQALVEHGIEPDLVIGTSVGAVNGAFIAGQPGPEGVRALGALWRGLRRRDVFPIGPLQGAMGYYGMRNWLVQPHALARLVRQHVRFARLEEAAIPFHAVATEVISGADVVLSRGETTLAVLASAAIPGVFPPQRVDGRELMDGGVANNTPIAHAVALGATRVYVLPAGHACALTAAPATALGIATHALTLLIGRGLAAEMERYAGLCELHVVPPLCPVDVSPADFSQAERLIARAYEGTQSWLAAGAMPASSGVRVPLMPHTHMESS